MDDRTFFMGSSRQSKFSGIIGCIFSLLVFIANAFAATISNADPESEGMIRGHESMKTIECLVASDLVKGEHAPSMKLYADLLRDGEFCKQDFAQAEHWYKQAYKLSDHNAGFALSQLYLQSESDEERGIALLEELASQGKKDALVELGIHFIEKGNLNKAASYLAHPLLGDNARAIGFLGLLHLNHDFDDYDRLKGLSLLLKAAEMGRMFFKFKAGQELVHQGQEVEEGIELIEEAATFEIEEAIAYLSQYYRNIEAKNEDKRHSLYWSIYDAAYEDEDSFLYILRETNQLQLKIQGDEALYDFLCAEMESLGDDGFLPAMETLGYFYDFGRICYQNTDKAIFWYEKAYENGSADSGFYLASILREVDSEYAQRRSLKLLRSLADVGHVWAATDLGLLYRNDGKHDSAKHYLEIGTKGKEPTAYYNLGALYLDEQSTYFSPKSATEAFRNGADLGDLNSQYHYGRLLVSHRIDRKKGLEVIKNAAELGDEQAQFALGLDYSSRYSEMYDPSLAKYWFLRSILSGSKVSKNFLANAYSTFDETNTAFSIAVSLLESGVQDGDSMSAMNAVVMYIGVENYNKAYHYADIALELSAANPAERFEFLADNIETFIHLAEFTPLSERIESLLDEYEKLGKSDPQRLHKAFYAKYQYYLRIGDKGKSKIYLSLAIQNVNDPEVKQELLATYQTSDISKIEDRYSSVTVLQLNEFIDNLYAGKSVATSKIIETVKTFKPEDPLSESTFLVAMEGFASYFLFQNDFTTTAKIAQIYVDYVGSVDKTFGNIYRDEKMRILSLLPYEYDTVSTLLADFDKYSDRRTLYTNPKIQRVILQSKLNVAHGQKDKAKELISTAFDIFTNEITSSGVCFSDFALSPEEYFEYFSKSELFDMATLFVDSLKKASQIHNLAYIRNNCGDEVREFGALIHMLLKDESASSIKEDWFNLLLSSFLYEDFSSQKKTLVNLASLNQIQDSDKRERFQQYIRFSRELDDKIGQSIAIQTQRHSIEDKAFDLSYFTQLSLNIRELEEEFYEIEKKNPLNPYRLSNFSVRDIQSKVTENEAVVIISALENELMGFYIDKTNFDTVSTELSKSQYGELRSKILSSVDQDDVSSPLDLKVFAHEEALELYHSFFEKFETLLTSQKRILVVFQGVEPMSLSIIPTEVLPKPVESALDFGVYRELDWFMENRDILYLSSLNMLFTNRVGLSGFTESPRTIGITPYWDNESNQFDLPSIAQNLLSYVFQGESANSDYDSLIPIHESINHVKALTQSKINTMLLGESASKASIVSELTKQRYDIVVFSTHVLADSTRVDMPSIVVKGEGGVGFDLLTTGEISQLQLDAGWVFLIGCNTGRTNFNTEFLSLADSFVLAGAKRVVMTDWPIEAKATTELSRIFQSLPGHASFTQKLSIAQSQLRNTRSNVVYAHPMFWGGFRVIGQP